MDKQHFTVVAGFEAEARQAAALAAAAQEPGFNLVRWQERADPAHVAEIVLSIYGYGLREASGLQGFAIICPAQSLGTLDKALAYAQEWAAHDPNRYVFIRNHALAQADKTAVKVAEREAGEARARQQQIAAQHQLGYHVGAGVPKAGQCAACDEAAS